MAALDPNPALAGLLADRAARDALALLEAAGHQAFLVGGAVRDALMGRPTGDLDMATDARPAQVMALAQQARIKALPTGIDHGTVTLLFGKTPLEVTTFRRDVATDGRRAVVAFADRLEDDAARRDFTVNALYADVRGQIHDPQGGQADLAARRLRFIGDADRRIAEDGLRVLRLYRFMAQLGFAPDDDALSAAARAAGALGHLSAERVTAELRKLLGADDPRAALRDMQRAGVLAALLPGADPDPLASLLAEEQALQTPPFWLRRLAALGGAPEHLRLSKQETRHLAALAQAQTMDPFHAGFRMGFDAARDGLLIAGRGAKLPRAREGAGAAFPLRAADLMPPLAPGPELGAALGQLQQLWLESGGTLDAPALLSKARSLRII